MPYARRRPRKKEAPSSALWLIEAYKEKDLLLYEYASQKLREMLDVYGIGVEQVRRFKGLNRVLGTPCWFYGAVYKRLVANAQRILG